MDKLTTERLEEIIQDAGFDTSPYSGRGMYGAECVSFEVEGGEELGAVAEIVSSIEDEEERKQVVKVFKRASVDSMGRDNVVIYFMGYKYPAHKVETEKE